jgi:glyoxylase-like metal-dependent hydrolase (beta-lactamase superfamily II)
MNYEVKIKALALDVDILGTQSTIHPVLIWDNTGATLVDTGYPGQFEHLMAAVTQAGVPVTQIRRIIITHQDWDHIGTLPDIIAARDGKVDILAHVNEKPYIEGTIPYIKMTPERIAARLQSIPKEMQAEAAIMFAAIPTAPITQTLEDGEKLPYHGGIEVIHTPGHTPGHICLYLKSHRLLIAGDQLRVENGTLLGPVEMYTADMTAALNSLTKLINYDIDRVICYHGGLYGPNAAFRIAELAGA